MTEGGGEEDPELEHFRILTSDFNQKRASTTRKVDNACETTTLQNCWGRKRERERLHAFLEVWKIASSSRYKTKQKKAQADQPKRILPPIQKNQKIILFFCASSGNFSTIGCKKRERTNWPKESTRNCALPVDCCRGIVRSRASRAQRRGGATLVLHVSKERSPNPRSQYVWGPPSGVSSLNFQAVVDW